MRTRLRETGGVLTGAAPGPTIASYFRSFAPAPSWEALCEWPPDVFALANVVLDQTEAYRFAVAPPAGRCWPPEPSWNERIAAAADEWRDAAGDPTAPLPEVVGRLWDQVARCLDTPLVALRAGREPALHEALLSLHAAADEACRRLSSASARDEGDFEREAWAHLDRHGSLSRIDPARIRVTPKTQFATRGITIRSFSRYLALNYESVEVGWQRIQQPRWNMRDSAEHNLVLLPWPLEVRASAFRPVPGPIDNLDDDAFGFFEFDPQDTVDLDLLDRMLDDARSQLGKVHAVVMPEDAVEAGEVGAVEERLGGKGVDFLLAGVRQRAAGGGLGRNLVHMGSRTRRGWEHFSQAKHNRWCLDEAQIRQYHLTKQLDPSKVWWEAIDLPTRTVQILDIGGGATVAPLVCEDLARLDEVADVLRRVGPSLVVALLIDGPQLPQRWSCRYASVLADEPGSAVLALTALGMATRSRPPGQRRSRAVATWSEPGSGLQTLELAPGAAGLAITVAVATKTVWTADGRRHEASTPALTLRRVSQLRAPR